MKNFKNIEKKALKTKSIMADALAEKHLKVYNDFLETREALCQVLNCHEYLVIPASMEEEYFAYEKSRKRDWCEDYQLTEETWQSIVRIAQTSLSRRLKEAGWQLTDKGLLPEE